MQPQAAPPLPDSTVLWRRIPPGPQSCKYEGESLIPSSINFRDKDDELSTTISTLTDLGSFLGGHDGFGVVAFTVADIMAVPGIRVSIRIDEEDRSHALICGKITSGQSRRLAKACAWVRKPAG